MTIHEIQYRNYQATVRRGHITPSTSKTEFIAKMREEIHEFEHSTDAQNEAEELADIVTVCLCFARHFNIDILNELRKVVVKNESRT